MVECRLLCDIKSNQHLFEMRITSGNNQSIFANNRVNFVHLFSLCMQPVLVDSLLLF